MIGTFSLKEFFKLSQQLFGQISEDVISLKEQEERYVVTAALISFNRYYFSQEQQILLYWFECKGQCELGYAILDKKISLDNHHYSLPQSFRHYVKNFLRGSSNQILLDKLVKVESKGLFLKKHLILQFSDSTFIAINLKQAKKVTWWEQQIGKYIQSRKAGEEFEVINQIPLSQPDGPIEASPNIDITNNLPKRQNPLTLLRVENATLKADKAKSEKLLEESLLRQKEFEATINGQTQIIGKLRTKQGDLQQQLDQTTIQLRQESRFKQDAMKALQEERRNSQELRLQNQQLSQKLAQMQQELTVLRGSSQRLAAVEQELAHQKQLALSKISSLKIEKLPVYSSEPHLKVDTGVDAPEVSGTEEKMVSELLEEQYLHIFEGNVLHAHLSEKQYLRQEIENYNKKQILMTRLLYRYDPENKTNYHKYIDAHPDFCVTIKLKNGRLIAGYSQAPLIEGKAAIGGGLILSLNEKKSFKLLEGKRPVTFDAFFLIFGNSELRLRHGDLTFFTNFGIANSFYNSQGQRYTVLTGEEGGKEETIEDYEIFEVVFR